MCEGKAAAVTPCDSLEPPLVLLKSGDLVPVSDVDTAKRIRDDMQSIVDLGEILIPFGEFLENNHVLMPGAFSLEWYGALLQARLGSLPPGWREPTVAQALEWSRTLQVPLHPRFNLFYHDFLPEELARLRERIAAQGRMAEGRLALPDSPEFRESLVRLGAPYRIEGGHLTLERHTGTLLATLGIASGWWRWGDRPSNPTAVIWTC